MNLDTSRQLKEAHELLDLLSAEKLAAVKTLLDLLADPMMHTLASAPVEDEEITSETATALDAARQSLARGEGIPHADILREFGLGR